MKRVDPSAHGIYVTLILGLVGLQQGEVNTTISPLEQHLHIHFLCEALIYPWRCEILR
jgi:hypothetical protein